MLVSTNTVVAENDPIAPVARLQEGLLEVMQNVDSLDYQERYEQIAQIIDETHDIPFIAKLTLGRHWNQLTEEQRDSFIDKFRDLSVTTYTSRFNAYNGEQFSIIAQKALPRGGIRVAGQLSRSAEKPIDFNYHLNDRSKQWRIVNIVVDGVSDLALKRAEYNKIMKDGDFSSLIDHLQDQITRYRE